VKQSVLTAVPAGKYQLTAGVIDNSSRQ